MALTGLDLSPAQITSMNSDSGYHVGPKLNIFQKKPVFYISILQTVPLPVDLIVTL